MAVIKPFRAYRPKYGLEAEIVALPYDVYNREEATEAVQGKPLSFLNIDRAETQFDTAVDTYDDRVYQKAHDFIYMGMKMPKENAPIVEASAYVSLVASAIIDTIKINPRNILILEDVDSYFNTKVISIETNKDKECYAKEIENYELKNTLFDGQALIDESIFPEWGNGYILLRHHMCKTAAFKSNIQLFFKEYFGKHYDSAIVIDMFGNEHKAKDIQMITTDNAMKWLKFDISYDYWCNRVGINDNTFGIVKTAHKSKLGNVQRMSYQMINSLDIDIMDDVMDVSKNYIIQLKKDDNVFLEYLSKNANFANDYDVLVALCEYNPEFRYSEYFRNRKKEIIRTYIKKFRTGKVIQSGDNLVIPRTAFKGLQTAYFDYFGRR